MLVRICPESRPGHVVSPTFVAFVVGLFLVVVLALGHGSAHAQASCTIFWDGGGDGASWGDASNWNTDTLPSTTDDVCINLAGSATVTHASGTTTINSLSSENPFTLSGGVLSIVSSSKIHGLFTISGGMLSGAGSVAVGSQMLWTGGVLDGTGVLDIPVGGQLRMEGPGVKMLQRRTINNSGTITWSGGYVGGGYGAVINNLAGATFDIAVNGDWNTGDGADATISNNGRLVKSAGSGMTTLNAVVNNNGALEVGSGGLRLYAGGTSSGSFSGMAGTTLEFGAGTHSLATSASVTSAGTVRFAAVNGGSVNLAGAYNVSGSTEATAGTTNLTGSIVGVGSSLVVRGGIISLSSGDAIDVASVTLASGSLAGTDTITASSVSWTGGRLDGTGVLNIPVGGQLRMEGPGLKALQRRTINNSGTISWSGGGAAGGYGAVINNLAGATFDITVNGDWGTFDGVGATINNHGRLVKSAGSGMTTLNAVVNNSGALEVLSGGLRLYAGGVSSGSFLGMAGTTLEFGAGTHSLATSASVTSAGTVRFAAVNGGSVNLAGAYSVSGSTEATAGTTNLSGSITGLGGSLVVRGGIINLSSGDAIDVASVTLASGSLAGTDTITALSVSWTGGRLDGTGVLNIPAGGQLRMEGPGLKALQRRTINNSGTISWSGGGAAGGYGAVINNLAGATFDITVNGDWGTFDGVGATINNHGRLVKSAGSGTTSLNAAVNNSGALVVETGTLWLVQQFPSFSVATSTLNRGTYLIKGTFRFPSANIVTNAAWIVLDGPASKIVDQSNVDGLRNLAANTASGTFTLQNGRVLTTPGAFHNAGAVTVATGSSFHAGGSYTQSGGTTRLDQGTLGANTSVDIQAGALSGVGTVVGNVSNSGQLIPGTSPGILTINGDYSQASRGALRIEIGGLTAGSQFDRLTVSGSTSLDGTLSLALIDSFSPSNSDSFQILSANSVSGSFAAIDGATIDAERAFIANYNATAVTLTITETTPNRPPTVDAGGPYTVPEGGATMVEAAGSDPDGDPHSFAWDLDGNGTFETEGSSVPFSAAALDGPLTRTIAVQISDGEGLTATDHAIVDVFNVNPTADLSNDGPISEGDDAMIRFDQPTDPASADTEAGLRYAFACDGGSLADATYAASSADPATSCTGFDNPEQTIRARILDKDGGYTEYETTLMIANVAPSVGQISGPSEPAQVNTSISASAPFRDAGVIDTHTAVWDWGDGTFSPGVLAEADGSGSVSGTHTYSSAGVYTVTLTVTDKDNAAGESIFQYVVVYDPSAGYVTGRGEIDSPAGAYTPDPSLAGEATFGFVSRYQKGATTPSGHTNFRLRVADLVFRSTDYQWLVVSGAKAQYKGSGTIKGSSAQYGFLLTATDGDADGSGADTFRIKIWDLATGAVIYDNQKGAADDAAPSTTLSKGKIIIHRGK